MQKLIAYFLAVLMIAVSASAATIHGSVYDWSLKKAVNARVEINTFPKQFVVAQNGSYSFNVPDGNYVIKAALVQKDIVLASAQENITIKQDGAYVLDLILFPDLEEGVEDIDINVEENVVDANDGNKVLFWVIAAIIFFIVIYALYHFAKNGYRKIEAKGKGHAADNELEELVKVIKREGGRTTQKDVRKHIPLSEAKISLMIAELEHKGVIEKIKKGRGNIIILKRK